MARLDHPTVLPFVRDILEHPEEDAARLIFADWLAERGDPLGEFIHVQCALEATPLDAPGRVDLEARELALVRQNSKGWAGPLRRLCRRWRFRRGFVESVRLPAETFLRHPEELFALAPIRDVELTHAGNMLDEIAACPAVGRLAGLGLVHDSPLGRPGDWRHSPWLGYQDSLRPWLTPEQELRLTLQEQSASELQRLLASPRLGKIRRLLLDGLAFGVPGATALADSPLAERLESLELAHTSASASALARLAASPQIRGLAHLSLDTCDTSGQGDDSRQHRSSLTEAFSPLLESLRSLALTPWPLSAADLDEMASQAQQIRLQSLRLQGARLSQAGADSSAGMLMLLDESPLWRELRSLDLCACKIDADALGSLLGSFRLRHLRRLALGGAGIGLPGVEAILRSPHAPRLTHLDLHRVVPRTAEFRKYRVEDEIVRLLASSERLASLASLGLASNRLTIESAAALLDSPLLAPLYRLDLSDNFLGDETAALFLRRGPWPRLAWLNLRGNRFGKAAKEALRKVYGERALV